MVWNQFGDFIVLDPDPHTINADPHHCIVYTGEPETNLDFFTFYAGEITLSLKK